MKFWEILKGISEKDESFINGTRFTRKCWVNGYSIMPASDGNYFRLTQKNAVGIYYVASDDILADDWISLPASSYNIHYNISFDEALKLIKSNNELYMARLAWPPEIRIQIIDGVLREIETSLLPTTSGRFIGYKPTNIIKDAIISAADILSEDWYVS